MIKFFPATNKNILFLSLWSVGVTVLSFMFLVHKFFSWLIFNFLIILAFLSFSINNLTSLKCLQHNRILTPSMHIINTSLYCPKFPRLFCTGNVEHNIAKHSIFCFFTRRKSLYIGIFTLEYVPLSISMGTCYSTKILHIRFVMWQDIRWTFAGKCNGHVWPVNWPRSPDKLMNWQIKKRYESIILNVEYCSPHKVDEFIFVDEKYKIFKKS